MPQRASVFCNFYIRVDREALVSERALDVGSVAFKAMSTKTKFTQERVEYVFLFDEPLKGSKSLKIFKISFPFCFNKCDNYQNPFTQEKILKF
jgi:hypothetical protein